MYSKLLCMFLYIVGLERSGAAAVALSCLFGGASASGEKIVIGGVLSVFFRVYLGSSQQTSPSRKDLVCSSTVSVNSSSERVSERASDLV